MFLNEFPLISVAATPAGCSVAPGHAGRTPELGIRWARVRNKMARAVLAGELLLVYLPLQRHEGVDEASGRGGQPGMCTSPGM
jgi:hypothetical protein